MAQDCRALLPDEALLVRGLRKKEINQETGKVKKQAFIPRRNGQDDDGLSVSRLAGESLERLKARLQNQDGLFCSLAAGGVRAISVEGTQLEVCPDPTATDEYHCLITGLPVSLADSALTNRLAEKLAAIATIYHPPEASPTPSSRE
jgi:hypothetical protein